MPEPVRGTDIAAGLAADQIIAGAAILVTFERLTPLRPPRRQLPAGAILTPGVEHLAPS